MAYLTRSMTYAELVVLIMAGQLNKGERITITDYATKHYIIDKDHVWLDDLGNPEISTGINEPLIVTALSNNVISREAKSLLHPYDTIYYDWNPENWKYDIGFSNNDEVVLPNWKGVIYWRHYTSNNISAPADWRQVKCRRWASDIVVGDNINVYIGIGSDSVGVSDPLDYQDFLMFQETETDPIDKRIMGLTINPFKDRTDLLDWVPTVLPNIVFHVKPDSGWWQILELHIKGISYNNTFLGDVIDCSIQGNFVNNIIGRGFYYNGIGSLFTNNIIGDGFSNNTIGSVFDDNVLVDQFRQNTIGSTFRKNKTFASFRQNSIGNYVESVIFPNSEFKNNLMRDDVSGTDITPLDFTGSTHTSQQYNCEVYRRQDGQVRLRYYDNTDTPVSVAVNA
jgi:hypothetical protein